MVCGFATLLTFARVPRWRGSDVPILVFANWAFTGELSGFWAKVYALKWWISSSLGLILVAQFESCAGKVIHVGIKTAVLALRSSPRASLGSPG